MRSLIFGAMVLLVANSAANAASPHYHVFELTEFTPDSMMRASAINNLGQVTGDFPSGAGDSFAFRTAANAAIDPSHDSLDLRPCCPTLGNPPKTIDSFGHAINDSGQVAGWGYTGGVGYVGFRTAPNAPIDWGHDLIGELTPGSTLPHGINASGQVTGQSGPDGTAHAFRTGPNASINPLTDDLGVLSGTRSEGLDINDTGMVVGNFYVYDPDLDDDVPRAFRSAPNNVPGPSIELGGLGGNSSSAVAVNNLGQIVGWAKRSDGKTRAFKLAPGETITSASDLGTLGGDSARAWDINNMGWIVGDAGTSDGSAGAFVYDGATMSNLNGLIDDGQSWIIYLALRINDNGQIIAYAERNGVDGYIRLDPVPEPAASGLLLMTAIALGRRKKLLALP